MSGRPRRSCHLIWQGDAMEAHTADGHLIGKYPTRREAAAALWTFLKKRTRHPHMVKPERGGERPPLMAKWPSRPGAGAPLRPGTLGIFLLSHRFCEAR